MRLLIDLQGCQTLSRLRGIGRYSLALVRAIVSNHGNLDIILMANGALVESLGDLKEEFSDFVKKGSFVVFEFQSPVAELYPDNSTRARLAELARERLIDSISPDAVLLTSLFEGFLDDAVTSIGSIGRKPLTATILYDLIPFINPDPAWPDHYQKYYSAKIESLKRSDVLLAISEYAKYEASTAIPSLATRITNISSACDEMFKPSTVSNERKDELLSRLGIKGDFIMSCSALDARKNFELLLRAYSALPINLRKDRQVVLVGSGDESQINQLRDIVTKNNLHQDRLVITGHLRNEDLLDLYRLCELFVFPSKHEGFGLPALEAMSCGAIVIGSNATSIPEVIGLTEALFGPDSVESLTNLLIKLFNDSDFRERLRSNGLKRASAFSWDKTAAVAIKGILDALNLSATKDAAHLERHGSSKPSLAIVSPLPPEKTGIADYMSDLLASLCKHYDITVISDQSKVEVENKEAIFQISPIEWFESNAHRFDRVLYQFGNSPFHAHMVGLMTRFPGVVVLHDFFASSLFFWMEWTGYRSNAIKQTLIQSHGFGALRYLNRKGEHAAKLFWPCSYDIVQNATAIIVHSEYSRKLIEKYYGSDFASKVFVTKHQRTLLVKDDSVRIAARKRLGIPNDVFLCCSFGFMDETKLNHRLLEAWAASSLSSNAAARLVFVGGNPPEPYSQKIESLLKTIDSSLSVEITGFADHAMFLDYLNAADCAVQLRTLSRGETSGTVLWCLAAGIPLIINSNGSLVEYPEDILIKLPDEFSQDELVISLESLKNDANLRSRLGDAGRKYVGEFHAPAQTAYDYSRVIEGTIQSRQLQKTTQAIKRFWDGMQNIPPDEQEVVGRNMMDFCMTPRRPIIYLDISATVRSDLKTGIERVARSLVNAMLVIPPAGYQVVPVYISEDEGRWHVRRASKWLSKQPGYEGFVDKDDLMIPGPGDKLVGLDLSPDTVIPAARSGLFAYWRAAGAEISFLVYDILPITLPECFPPWASSGHQNWVQEIATNSNQLICISKHVKSELLLWLKKQNIKTLNGLKVQEFYLGSDLDASLPTKGIPDDAKEILGLLENAPTFLMVGTIEPRKGYLQVLEIFEHLWSEGVNINLVIVGKEGWKNLPDEDRRTIPKIIEAINNSSQRNKRLFWLEGISDEYLELLYKRSDCLIAASLDEGFGLPLIEAYRHGLKILARDIPIFREVGHLFCEYFADNHSENSLENIIRKWPIKAGSQKKIEGCLTECQYTWAESSGALIKILLSQ